MTHIYLLICIALFGAANAILEDSSAGQNSRIVGGNEAYPGQFTYQVALMYSGSLFCGGTWIKTDSLVHVTVLTAAHCVEGLKHIPPELTVVFGLHDIRRLNDVGVLQLRVDNMTIHENYNTRTLSNDVATIIIYVPPSEVEKISRASPIALTQTSYSHGENGTVSGWGTTQQNGVSPDVLHYVSKPILSLDKCKQSGYNPSWLDDTMMCCGETNKDACQGDSGGPLVVTRNSGTVLVGVVSWGIGCGDEGYPGVYADVNNLRSWIENKS